MLGFGKPKDLCYFIAMYPNYFGNTKTATKAILKAVKLNKMERNYLSFTILTDRIQFYVNKSELKKLEKLETKLKMFRIVRQMHRDRSEGGEDRKLK